jgi:methionyl-tRNA synthetase
VNAATSRSRVLNLYIDRTKPWALAKQNTPESMSELREVLYTLLEGIAWVATSLGPVLPFGMPEVFRQIGLSEAGQFSFASTGETQVKWGARGYRPGEPKPIFPRLEMPVPAAPPAQ